MNRMPAEWEHHKATWLTWPKNIETFLENLDKIQAVYLKAIPEIAKGEEVHLLVDDELTKKHVSEKLSSTKNVFMHLIPTRDVWIRDYGPTFLDGKKAVHWIFNAWGDKYPELAEDTIIPEKIKGIAKVKLEKPGIVMEGGSIEVNGKGQLITTEQCLLNKNRNPTLSKKQIEEKLKNHLGVKEIIWLKEGIVGDDTDGHVDDICRFVNEKTVLAAWEENEKDENHAPLAENYYILKQAGLKVIKLQMPKPVFFQKTRLPASYANFYIANECILVPVFNQPADANALKTIASCFPTRKIVPLESNEFVVGLGAIHCSSQQQPKVI